MTEPVVKLSHFVPVSAEVLTDAEVFRYEMERRRRLTPEQRAAEDAEWEARKRERDAAITAEHEALLAQAKGIIRDVLDLHGPVFRFGGVYCEGCDAGSYAESAADWPCRTYSLIRNVLVGVE